jgi:hypothetical protein
MKSTVLVPILLVAGVASLAGLAGCSSSSGGPAASAASSATPAAASPAASSAALAAASPAAAASGASLDVTLNHLRIAGPLGVGVTADIAGQVPQLLDGDGQPVSAADTEAMGTHITWGDGAEDGSDPGDVTCSTSGALVPLSEQYQYSHTYAKAGTYTVTFTVGACAPLEEVTKTLAITVG